MDGLNRIRILASEVKHKPVLKIVEYLLSREDMNDKYLNEEKSLKQMLSFIKAEAHKHQEDGCAILEDEEVYGIAIHYWDETNENLKIDKVEKIENKKNVPSESKKDIKKDWVAEGQLTLF